MSMNLTRLTTGSGVDYLLSTVAVGDGRNAPRQGMADYYAATGTPPGRWWGRGAHAADLHDEETITRDGADALFKHFKHPNTGVELGSRPRGSSSGVAASAVAGFDLTFTIPKSVSVVWAVADEETQRAILAAHETAVSQALEYVEDEVLQTRSGRNGVASVGVRGMIAGRFNHWESREGDPHLHTHVVVSNRVQRASDGKWLSVDSRGLHRSAVAVSELHQNLLLDELHRSLGMTFAERTDVQSNASVHDVTGVDPTLISTFSVRDQQIKAAQKKAVDDWTAKHGKKPTGRELARIHQDVWRATRKAKATDPAALPVLRTRWRRQAEAAGVDVAQVLAATVNVDRSPDADTAAAHDIDLASDYAALTLQGFADRYAGAVVAQIRSMRSTWTLANLRAEAERLTRGVRCASAEDRRRLISTVVQAAAAASIEVTERRYSLTPEAAADVSLALRGSSVFDDDHNRTFTDQSVLDAEALVLAAAETDTGPALALPATTTTLAALSAQQESERGFGFAADQLAAAAQVVTDGHTVSAIVGPAGTGKTTTMRAVRAVWEATYGEGSVTGLTTSAQAAAVLGGELDAEANTVAKWLHETVGDGARQRSAALADQQAILTSSTTGYVQKARARRRTATLLAQSARWKMRPGQLVIIDEASMTGTHALAEITRQAQEAGAKVLLVGDPAQLDAVEAGGVLGWLERSGKATHLTSVWRFTAEWEKDASLALRVGNLDVLDTYIAHDRVRHGDDEQILEDAFTAARADQAAGRSTILIAATNAVAADLNQRFTLERRAAGEVQIDTLVDLRGGTTAGVGEQILARKVDRSLRDDKGDFIRNGTQMTVTRIGRDRSLTATRSDTGATVTLPAAWVAQHVELGYAITAHRAQGTTVDVGHVAIPSQNALTRELLYVAMTRGRESNVAWVGQENSGDSHSLIHPAEVPTWRDTLEAIATHTSTERTAHEVAAQSHDDQHSLSRLSAERDHLLSLSFALTGATQRERITTLISDSLGTDLAERLRGSDRYSALASEVARLNGSGVDAAALLSTMAATRELASAEDPARVLLYRLERHNGGETHAAGLDPVAGRMTRTGHGGLDDLLRQSTDLLDARVEELRSRDWRDAPWAADLPIVHGDRAWNDALAAVAVYRDRFSWDGDTPLGPVPAEIDRTRLAAWSDAHRRLADAARPPATDTPTPVRQSVAGATVAPRVDHSPGLA
ncbi:relaxase domain-containing protein [Sanguibacter hominis ATCC BAA-789]|uniref:Relaxase domain-containing protein n=1 Tax=Sanguibacter hominis ATCC BAA-789 TaxID=1312740 RepID=A0A9X5FGV4_9MICO|nr:MobF family relaxase [Sanguibacter hominis]NKX94274.1 relaxase domain-containing protein [Sanguibacter hominis ATCC BAA-789]